MPKITIIAHMNDIQDFRRKLSELSDKVLLDMVESDIGDYSKQEVEEVWSELERRDLEPADETTAAASNIQQGISWQALSLIPILSVVYLLSLIILSALFSETGGGRPGDIQGGHSLIIHIGVALFIFFAIRYAVFRRRYKALSAEKLLVERPGEPVIYLRAFGDDAKAGKVIGHTTEAEQLAIVMNKIGPFIAIGRPGETLPEAGAARMYVSADRWQDAVSDLMLKARLVVVRIGQTPGLWWEVKTATSLVQPERLLFLVPRDQDFYERFRERVKQYLPCTLPEYIAETGHVGGLKGAIYFEPDWTPHFVKFENSYGLFRGTFEAPGVPSLTAALRPVFAQLQVEWREPPVRLIKVIGFAVSFFFLFLSIFRVFFALVYAR